MEVVAKDVTGAVAPETKTVDNNTVEQKQVEPSPQVSEDHKLSAKYAAFARQQKAIREQQRQFQESKKAFEVEKQNLEKLRQESEEYKNKWDLLQKDPLTALSEAGLSYDQITQLMLNAPKIDPEMQKVNKELDFVKKSLEEQKLQAQKAQEAQYEQAKRQIRSDLESLISTDDSYETIKATQSLDAVVDLIEMTFNDSGKLMTIEEAAKEVEDYLIEQALGLVKLKKIQSKINPPVPQVQEEEKQQLQTQKQPAPTLSNRIVPSLAKSLTAKERRDRAIAAFQGKITN